MPVDEDWDEWIDKFVTKIVQILEREYAECQLERVAKATQKPKNELIHAAIVTDLKYGSQVYLNTVKVPKKPLKSNSIGRIYEAFLL
jgi:hypothetical protein